jgi:hypothetical protein
MRNFSFEPIVLLLIFVMIPLANYVLQRMRRRFEPPKPTGQPVPDMGFRRQAAPTPAPASLSLRERAQEAPPTRVLALSRRRWSRRTLFRNRREVRRVIVAMTVLGPCRAYDPPG